MTILLIDDERNLRRMLRALLESEGYEVAEAANGAAALQQVDEFHPEAVLLDLVFPGESGLDLLPRIRERAPGTPVVMMSGEASLSDAVEATRQGAFHFLEKPLTPESVLITLRAALELGRARDLSRAVQEELGPGTRLVGSSEPMQRVREAIRKVGPTDARVLISGESGTGKELAAAAIHALSSRSAEPFVRVNSAAIPRDLVESEMFGHEKGAFTGATERRRGRFELAHRGTLFLDEIADLGAEAQAKLLRTLETGAVQRVGGQHTVDVDVRVLAATNTDLREAVEEGTFREDLLFRLDVVPLTMPPLRDRPEDLGELVEHGLERLRTRHAIQAPTLGPEAIRRLQAYPWPGNVRELFNLLERIAILHPGDEVDPATLDALLSRGRQGPSPAPGYRDDDDRTLRDRLDAYEATLIRGALRVAEGNVAEAARRLQTDRANLYRRMKRLEIEP